MVCSAATNVDPCFVTTSRNPGDCGRSTALRTPRTVSVIMSSWGATVNTNAAPSKAALWYQLEVPAARPRRLPSVFRATVPASTWLAARRRVAARSRRFLRRRSHPSTIAHEDVVLRQALAGMLWSKQFYHYDVERWLDGDPAQPPPPEPSMAATRWRHLNNHDIISMPDKWEYPWYAAWDLAFHCVRLAPSTPGSPRNSCLLCREWYMHPMASCPRTSGVRRRQPAGARLGCPARLRDRRQRLSLPRTDHSQAADELYLVGKPKRLAGNNMFEGGFLGLDNIGPFDRSTQHPENRTEY